MRTSAIAETKKEIFKAPGVIAVPDNLQPIRMMDEYICMQAPHFLYYEEVEADYLTFPERCQVRLDGAKDLLANQQRAFSVCEEDTEDMVDEIFRARVVAGVLGALAILALVK